VLGWGRLAGAVALLGVLQNCSPALTCTRRSCSPPLCACTCVRAFVCLRACLLQLAKERDEKALPLDLRTGGALGEDGSEGGGEKNAEAAAAEGGGGGGAKKQFVKKGKATEEEVDQPEFTKVEVKVGQITKVRHVVTTGGVWRWWCGRPEQGDVTRRDVATCLPARHSVAAFWLSGNWLSAFFCFPSSGWVVVVMKRTNLNA
jgi:hypothetical protein